MKKVKITTIILAIILVTLVSFAGVYIKTQNRMENKVKDYSFGRELKGERVIEMKVATGDEEDSETNLEMLTAENYEITKKTIENRLNNLAVQDYTISLNKDDGTIIVELPEDKNTDTYVYFLTASGEVQIKEKDAETELLSDSMVKKATYTYTSDVEGAYQVYLELQLTKEGQAKIEEIKNSYAVLADEIDEIESAQSSEEEDTAEGEEATTEESENTESTSESEKTADTEEIPETEENKEETKKIAVLTIAGTEYDIEKIEKNKIRVAIGGKTTNTTSVNNNISSAAELAMLINSGKYPLKYEVGDNRFVYTDITKEQIKYFLMAIAIIILMVFAIFTIKYKTKGLLASISCIGFVSILLLLLRYANVNISIEGIGAIILVLIINFRINQIILSKTKTMNVVDQVVLNTYKEVFLKLVPVIIIILVFCFARWSNLSSFGMIMFWGLILIAVYNVIVTKTLLKLKESK